MSTLRVSCFNDILSTAVKVLSYVVEDNRGIPCFGLVW